MDDDLDNKSDYLDGRGKGKKRKHPSISEDDQSPRRRSARLSKKSISPSENKAKTVLYQDLLNLNEVHLVNNFERFACPVCFDALDVGEGVTLKECLHSACKECLASAVAHCKDPLVKCPYNECGGHLQQREVKALVSPEMFGRYLGRSVTLAENQAPDSFHCRAPDCVGWWLREGEGNLYDCPVCGQENCVECFALHGGRVSCEEWRRTDMPQPSAEVKKSRAYVEKALKARTAMLCPKCQAVITKVSGGCDGMECSKCKTEICWATRGPRWGPKGRGDKSGGCGCTQKKMCHPKCKGCH